jgi:hypothetical protein
MDNTLKLIGKDWRTLNEKIGELREDQLKQLLDWESANLKRQAMLERIHQRYNAVRGSRERYELMTSGRLL